MSCTYQGKHSTKKDDYLMTTMQVAPKQRIHITPFDLRTQRDAFSVSLDGLKGVCSDFFETTHCLLYVCAWRIDCLILFTVEYQCTGGRISASERG